MQTRDGYLWLARFDGVRFTVFNESNSPGIVNNRFISLFEAANGDLWAGTEESGIVRFRGGRFEHFGAGAGVSHILNWIESDAGGDGVIFHVGNQAFRFSDGKFSPFEMRANLSPTARTARTASVRIVCRSNFLNQFSECFINWQWFSFPLLDGAPQGKLVKSAQEANGSVWLITADGARGAGGKRTSYAHL